jgi:hypothetical protein
MLSSTYRLAGAMLLLLVACAVVRGQSSFEFTDHLRLNWPWDLTYRDYPKGTFGDEPLVVRFGDMTRPAQVERRADADRVWFVATLSAPQRGELTPTVTFTIEPGRVEPGITMNDDGSHHVIDNGKYQFRVPHSVTPVSPLPLERMPHWIAGVRAAGEQAWDGRAWFDGTAPCVGMDVQVRQAGPVWIELAITYRFEQPPAAAQVEAVPLATGKQTHTFAPNHTPREMVAKDELRYELLVRFVMGDPWVDVNERYRLPRDEGIKPWGIHGYFLHVGRPPQEVASRTAALPADQHMAIDSAMWVRWFEYDQFGGNVDQRVVPAAPRAAQKGRPFALLRPIWNQGGGGAQDFFLTGGGGDDPQAPTVGMVAAYPSKWVGPWQATIAAYAYDGERGMLRFGLTDAGHDSMHYGQRAYGLCVGRRSDFNSINNVVRRHTDWTLAAQMNRYILDWPRDPAKAGPTILVTRNQLDALRSAYRAGDQRIRGEINVALDQAREDESRLTALKARRNDVTGDERKAVDDQVKAVERRLQAMDVRVARLIATGEGGSTGQLPGPDLWLQRRYQDDFLNPTSGPVRRLKDLGVFDLFAGGKPMGGAPQAAMAYIATDLDAWIGYHHGWAPGNPNFHTDKYMIAAYLAAILRDHPHSDEWFAYALDNFKADLDRTLLAPDGVGVECPGYAGYALSLQLGIARIFLNAGFGNPITQSPLTRASGTWHRHLLTPVDPRLHRRHEAPIGDTHRWDSGLGDGFGQLATFWRDEDPTFAAEMMGVWRYLESVGVARKDAGVLRDLLLIDPAIPARPLNEMDWTSRTFEGFGAILRDGFGRSDEAFLSVKAGAARGHYHNDETSFHFYANGTPIALDYNCSYTPRGDHAALHNTMTFGREGQVQHNQRNQPVRAMEEASGVASVVAFAASPHADAVTVERRIRRLTLSPVEPQDSEFGRQYPAREVEPITHRRTMVLVKHGPDSPLSDYLVVREQVSGSEPQQLNLHLLAREATIDGTRIALDGQWSQNMLVQIVHASNPRIERLAWHYHDVWVHGPMEYAPMPDESVAQWDQRMRQLMKEHKVTTLPLPGWKTTHQDPKLNQAWFDRIAQTGGLALSPPLQWTAPWTPGEYQVWLRVHADPGTSMIWIIYPHARDADAPVVTGLNDSGLAVTLGDHVEQVRFADDGVIVTHLDSEVRLNLPSP